MITNNYVAGLENGRLVRKLAIESGEPVDAPISDCEWKTAFGGDTDDSVSVGDFVAGCRAGYAGK
jgi:hypothetical protein